MPGLAGVNVDCRRTRGGEGRRNLARDVAGLAHAGDHQLPPHVADQIAGLGKVLVKQRGDPIERLRLGPNDFTAALENMVP